jgi:hypothetical protein
MCRGAKRTAITAGCITAGGQTQTEILILFKFKFNTETFLRSWGSKTWIMC